MEPLAGHGGPSFHGALVGRDVELTRLLDWASSHPARGGFLVGESGVGKTRLARECVQQLAQAGWATAWVSASPSSSAIPFGAISHAVPGGTVTRDGVFSAVVSQLNELGGGARVALCVDDAHELDDASAALVHHLAASGAATLIATVRSRASLPEAVTALWKDELCGRLDIGPLSRDDTGHVAHELLGGPVDAFSLERLWRLCSGNALYLRELIAGGRATGALVAVQGLWVWQGQVTAAPRLIELVAARIDRQPPEVQDLVDLVSFGEPLSVATVECLGIPVRVIETAERMGFVRTSPGGTRDVMVRLGHPMIGEAMRRRATPLHQREICRRLVGCVGDASPGHLMRSAIWHLDAGLPKPSGLLTTAAGRALGMMDLTLAERLARAAVEAGDGWAAKKLLASILVLTGEAREAEGVLEELLLGNLPGDVRASVVAERATNLVYGLDRPAEAGALLDALAASRAGRGIARARAALLLSHAGQHIDALAAATQAIESLAPCDIALADAHLAMGQALTVSGLPVSGTVAAGKALAVLDACGDDWSMVRDEVCGMLAVAQTRAGRLAEAEALITHGRQRMSKSGWRVGSAMWMWFEADLRLHRGQVAESLALAQQASALLERERHPYGAMCSRLLHLMVARAAAQLADPVRAAGALTRAQEAWRDCFASVDDLGDSALGWVSVARGRTSEALGVILHEAENARARGSATAELTLLHQVVRTVGADLGSSSWRARTATLQARLEALSGVTEGELAPLQIAHGLAVLASDGGGLDGVADGFARLGFTLLAAEAAGQASLAHRAAGHNGSAMSAAVRARAWAGRCGGASTPALRRLDGFVALTAREHEIAELAADGLTSRAIALSLVVSIRTVDNTLRHVYTKAGVSRRVDLARVLGLHGDEDLGAGC